MNTTLNFGRLMALLRLDFVTKNKTYIYGALGFLAAYCLFTIIGASDGDPLHDNFYPMFLLFFGLVFSSNAFQEMNAPLERQTYLTLPASNLEKMTSKWVLTFIVFPIIFTLGYWFLSSFVDRIIEFFMSAEIQRFKITGEETIVFLKIYLAIQGIFVIGSVIFNRYAFIKTGTGMFILFLSAAFIMVLCVRIIFIDHFKPWSIEMDYSRPGAVNGSVGLSPNFETFLGGPFKAFGEYLFWIGLPILSWIVAYFKLKEKEV